MKGHPKKNHNYVLGSDISGGTGNDYSTCEIICVETLEQVLEYKVNNLAPPEFYPVLENLGREYNEAYLVVESNQHGLSVLSLLKTSYPILRIYKEYKNRRINNIIQAVTDFGFRTTAITKPFIIGLLQKYLIEYYIIYGLNTQEQLLEYTETETGRMEGPEDDLVIALALTCIGVQKEQRRLATRVTHEAVDQFIGQIRWKLVNES